MATRTKQTATPVQPLPQATETGAYVFRAIYRGTDSTGKRVRRVRNVHVSTFDYGAACEASEPVLADMHKAEPLADPYSTVYPPVGLKCNGKPSKNWGLLPDGSMVYVGADHRTGDAAPAHVAAKYGFGKAAQAKPAKAAAKPAPAKAIGKAPAKAAPAKAAPAKAAPAKAAPAKAAPAKANGNGKANGNSKAA